MTVKTGKPTTKQRMGRVKVKREKGIETANAKHLQGTRHKFLRNVKGYEVPLWRVNLPTALKRPAGEFVYWMKYADRVVQELSQADPDPRVGQVLAEARSFLRQRKDEMEAYLSRLETLHKKKHNIPGFGFHRRMGFHALMNWNDVHPMAPVHVDFMRRIATDFGHAERKEYLRKLREKTRGKRMVI